MPSFSCLPKRLLVPFPTWRESYYLGNIRSLSTIRLNKWLAQQGLCSRREADVWMRKGWIRVNGVVIVEEGAVFVTPGLDQVQINPKAQQEQIARRGATILLHKPLGIVSSQPEPGNTPAVQLLTAERQFIHQNQNDSQRPSFQDSNPYRQNGWRVCGRLDINSTGLLVLTQSGVVARQIVSPGANEVSLQKEYLVRIPPGISENIADLEQRLDILRKGIVDDGDLLTAQEITLVQDDQLRMTLTAGKRHHIRRMCAAVKLPVRALKRVRIGRVVLGNLPVGYWRYLGPHETFLE